MEKSVCILYSESDTKEFILPLCQEFEIFQVRFWLEPIENIQFEDVLLNVVRNLSAFNRVLICMSESFIESKLANSDLELCFDLQKKLKLDSIIVLILNGKRRILDKFPLLLDVMCKEVYSDIKYTAKDLVNYFDNCESIGIDKMLSISCANPKSGANFCFRIQPNKNFYFLLDRIKNLFHLEDTCEIGNAMVHQYRWIIVESDALDEFDKLFKIGLGLGSAGLFALFKNGESLVKIYDGNSSLQNSILENEKQFVLREVLVEF